MQSLGIIGGSGVYGVDGIVVVRTHTIETPFGAPSGPIVEAEIEHAPNALGESKTRLLFLPRHGENHQIAPHQINFRANVCALKLLGVDQIVSVSAVGSMKEEIRPGDVVIVDQYIDWTKRRPSTFFEDGIVAHVSVADPTCPALNSAAALAVQSAIDHERAESDQEPRRLHVGGTYLCMEGPQFSTRAESQLYRSWGVSVIGMTAMPEAKLAREACIPYTTLAFSTDYDCWHEEEADVSVEAVLTVLKGNAALAQMVIAELPERLPNPADSPARKALDHAIISKGTPGPELRERLNWLVQDWE